MSIYAQVGDFLKEENFVLYIILLAFVFLILLIYEKSKNGKEGSNKKITVSHEFNSPDVSMTESKADSSIPNLSSFKPVKPLNEFSYDEIEAAITQTEDKLTKAILDEKKGKTVFGGIDPIQSDLAKLKKYIQFRKNKVVSDKNPSSETAQNNEKEQTSSVNLKDITTTSSTQTDEPPKPLKTETVKQTSKVNPVMQDQPHKRDEFEERLRYLEDLAKQQKTEIDEEILFCPASSNPEPMVKLRVGPEIIDISKAGSWYDGGELISILKRDKNFLSKLLLQKSSVVKLIEKGVGKQSELASLRQQTCVMAQKYVETQNSEYEKRCDLYNARVVALQKFSNPSFSSTNKPGTDSTVIQEHKSVPNVKPNPIGHIDCPASGVPMKKETFDGETLDVSPSGVWFDGRGHKGRTEPELISILKKKPGFFKSILSSDSVINQIEGKRKEVASGAQLQNEISETKKRIQSLSVRLSKQPHNSFEFSSTLSDVRKEISKLDKLSSRS